MPALFAFACGIAAYAACLVTLLYLIAFSGNLFVPRSVDVGPGAPLLPSVMLDLGLLVLFALQHSVMARQGFKRWWARIVPPVVERSTFVVATSAVLGLLLGFWATPVMTAGHLLFAAGATAYILVDIAFEERDLVRRFGDAYRRYSAQVGMLVPWRSRG